MKIELYNADCLEKMKDIPDGNVDAMITDPPYGLSFMGKKWDYEVPSVEIWQECLRVLKPGGYLLSFAGTRTQHRMACNIEDAGFEIRDMIAWVYGSGFPKSLNIGKAVDKLQGNKREEKDIIYPDGSKPRKTAKNFSAGEALQEPRNTKYSIGVSEWEGWGTALKPALEPICVARKPLSEKTVAENVLKWGTGGLNIDECRIPAEKEVGSNGLANKIFSNSGSGISQLQHNKLHETTIQNARFPANLIHDGSDEVVGLFPNTVSKWGKQKSYTRGDSTSHLNFASNKNNVLTSNKFTGDSGSASRFFYCAKASKAERNKGCENKNYHPTVKPITLMEYLIKLVSREGTTILDPFMGSGTTGIACKNLNRNFIGIEKDEQYFKIAKERIDNMPNKLF